jgi:hypothetical protein
MKLFISYLAVIVYASASPAVDTESAATNAVPKITCDAPTFSFGEQDQDQDVAHTFKLKNEGTATLKISKVKPACGCTVATISSKILEPGEIATVAARLSLKGRRGVQRKSITVESNDPKSPNYRLWITGTAVIEIGIEPTQVNFGQISGGDKPLKKEAKLISRKGDARIVEIVGASEKFTAEKADDENGNATRIVVTALPPFERGYWRGEFTIKTTHPGKPDIKLPVSAMVPEKVYVIPSTVILRGNHPKGLNRSMLIRPGTVKKFKVLGVELPVEGVKVQVKPLGMGNQRILLYNFPVDRKLDGKLIWIKTDVPGKERISVPIRVIP